MMLSEGEASDLAAAAASCHISLIRRVFFLPYISSLLPVWSLGLIN